MKIDIWTDDGWVFIYLADWEDIILKTHIYRKQDVESVILSYKYFLLSLALMWEIDISGEEQDDASDITQEFIIFVSRDETGGIYDWQNQRVEDWGMTIE